VRVKQLAPAIGCALLLTPALMLSLIRLVEPSWGKAVQAEAFTPFGLPLYAAALVLLLTVMGVRRTVSVGYSVPAVLAGAGLVLHAAWFAPMVVGETPAPAADADRAVVMTANVLRGRGDGADLVEQARDRGVDLLVVNEITGSALEEMEAAGLDDLLPERVGEPGVEDSVVGTMVFGTEPISLVDRLPTNLDSLVVDTGGLRVLAVHPMSPMWPDDWRADHADVLAAARTFAPDLLAGDFNATADHPPMRALADAGYRDSVELTNGGFQPTWPVNGGFGWLGLLGPVAQIDHVLVSDDLTVTETDNFDLDGADHRPVVATVAPR
jgi:endonuclease/exonuclease/phosphatase (EEP) superfamily protein YafD